ncbi:unnamed protein product [Citrullus colocynthis]|uniref:Uncharacterized protein n=1 Tax=Citrullus colocynthis TaxID=252529 RepID=A0ABP0XZ86_9ROSI
MEKGIGEVRSWRERKRKKLELCSEFPSKLKKKRFSLCLESSIVAGFHLEALIFSLFSCVAYRSVGDLVMDFGSFFKRLFVCTFSSKIH